MMIVMTMICLGGFLLSVLGRRRRFMSVFGLVVGVLTLIDFGMMVEFVVCMLSDDEF